MSGIRWNGLELLATPGAGAAPIFGPPGTDCGCFEPAARLRASGTRTRLWELPEALHCSVIGTCLTTAELRRVLGRLDLAPAGSSDHDLHARAVAVAGRPTPAAKALGKALDERHRTEINRFDRAATESEVRKLWQDAVRDAAIPGAYWAVLTHPGSTPVLVQEAFGEVHMLSHLLGAANRADLRRLRMLELEAAELRDSLERQRLHHQAMVAGHEGVLRDLRREVAAPVETAAPNEDGAKRVATLERRLAAEIGRRETAEQSRDIVRAELGTERKARRVAEERLTVLASELAATDLRVQPEGGAVSVPARLDGQSFLYVGGRAGQVAHLRSLAERAGAAFLHHDGGIEDSADLLPGLVARADLVLFPVDCVSHDAALRVKRLCRQADKRFVPLRSTGAASFLSGIATAA